MSETPEAGRNKVVVVGGGRVGEAILRLLRRDRRYAPFVLEIDYDRLRALGAAGIPGAQIGGTEMQKVQIVLRDAACVICAAPPSVCAPLARAAAAEGCHYIDLCEQAAAVEAVAAKAAESSSCFVPGCGLAPGLVSAVVGDMLDRATGSVDITAYVGVLPSARDNRLGYGNIWGIDGLIAEYSNPCLALERGAVVSRPALDGLETVEIGGERFEAFCTAGSLDDMVRHHRGGGRSLRFKTLRYPGHLDYIRFLLDDLRLSERPYMFRNLLMNGLPRIARDRVIVHIVDRGPDVPVERSFAFEPEPFADGRLCSAAAAIAAQHVCAVLDVVVQGLARKRGLLHHADLPLELLGQSRYGQGWSAAA